MHKIHSADIAKVFAIGAGVIATAVLVLVIGFIFVKGFPELVKIPNSSTASTNSAAKLPYFPQSSLRFIRWF